MVGEAVPIRCIQGVTSNFMERERGGGGNGREGESTREGVQIVRACAGEIRQKKENSHQRQKRKKEMRALM